MQANLLISSALSGFVAQPCRLTTSFCASKSTYDVVKFSDKRGSKCPKKPPNSPFLLGIAEHSVLRGDSMSPCLFLQQNTVQPDFYYLSSNCRILRSMTWLAVLGRFRVQIATQGFLVAYTGMFTAEKKKAWMVFGCSHFFAELRLPPRNSPDHPLYFRRDFSIYHPDFIVQVDFTDPPKLEGGVCHKPLCCRRCRRTWDEAEAVYHPDSFTCLIFDRRKSGCRGNADSLYILLFCC